MWSLLRLLWPALNVLWAPSMDVSSSGQKTPPASDGARPLAFLLDLAIYLPVMFLVREICFPALDFIVNGLFWSLTTLLFAT